MQGKIVLEEHFATDATLEISERKGMGGSGWKVLRERLKDFEGERLQAMDRNGIEWAVTGLNSPSVQAVANPREATELTRVANDILAESVSKRPDRFGAFAALPMIDPDAATRELTRCIHDLGFVGAMVHGFCETAEAGAALYYDLPQFDSFWATVSALDVPFFLHPRDPLPNHAQVYAGHPWFLGAAWAFGVETSIHALRLMASGLFDRHPNIQLILGHLGEGIPASVWRLDHTVKMHPRGIPAKRAFSDYLRANVHVLTSGNFHRPTLLSAIAEMGVERILFSVDYPFESNDEGATWFDRVEITEQDRMKIGRTNALGLFKRDSR